MTKEKKTDIDNLENVSQRLKYLIDTLGVKQSHMANKLGLSASGLHYILNNDVKFSKNAKKIAKYLSENEQWLKAETSNSPAENTSIKTYKIPIYYPDQLKLYYNSERKNKVVTNDYHMTTTNYPNNTIAIYNIETDLSPKFEIGDIIVFEQTENFTDGDIMLVYLTKLNKLTIKYTFQIHECVALLSNNDTHPIKLTSESEYVLIGTYRECLKRKH